MTLSQNRAQAVMNYLVSRGVPAEAITAVGVGPDRPIADNSTRQGRAENRRVEIIVKPMEER
jgi:outer membrane protein OmpA-like peptidoglycan-associated protein